MTTSQTSRIGVGVIVCVCIIGALLLRNVTPNVLLHNPVTETQPAAQTLGDQTLQVYGFLPYWNIRKLSQFPDALTHVALFGLPIISGGKLDTSAPAYTAFATAAAAWITTAHHPLLQRELTLTLFDNTIAEQLLTTPDAHTQLRQEIARLLQTPSPLTGINLDVEYTGSQSAVLQPAFTRLVQDLSNDLHTMIPPKKLTLSVYTNAIDGENIWDIPQLAQHADAILIMGYDFHRASSPFAGPVAPLLDLSASPEKNIAQYIQRYLAAIPATKILLGVPFYGYEWQTVSSDPRAATFPKTGATASYARIQTILADPERFAATTHWDKDTLSPYIKYTQDDKQKIIYYEDAHSLGYKLDFVRQTQLGGIGIWALGYEGDDEQLWQVIDRFHASVP